MAEDNVDQDGSEFVPFITTGDEGCIPAGHGHVPGLIIHPHADSVNLWGLAESRLMSLEKMLAMFASASGTDGAFTMADVAEVVMPRVQEILTLASTGNSRASLTRFADGALRNSLR